MWTIHYSTPVCFAWGYNRESFLAVLFISPSVKLTLKAHAIINVAVVFTCCQKIWWGINLQFGSVPLELPN